MSNTSSLSRRHFLAAGATALAAAVLPAAEARATDRVAESPYDVPVPGLPVRLAGVRVAQVSDLHLYAGIHAAAAHALAVLDEARPDLIVLTGDQWDHTPGAHTFPAWLRQLPAGVPVVAVLGNHEYSAGFSASASERLHRAGGAELLVNETTTVSVRGERLAVVGLADYRYGRDDATRAMRGAPAGVPQLWLQHEPEQMDATRWPDHARAALVLGGHTHGGQVRLLGAPVITPRGSGRYVSGWYDSPVGRYYISRGVGTSSLRLRVGCPAEVPVFTLRAA
jgi:predicted MPP superfamily phosphohydrolase